MTHYTVRARRWPLCVDPRGYWPLDASVVQPRQGARSAGLHLCHVPMAVIAEWLGHADASITANIYAHSQRDALGTDGAAELHGGGAGLYISSP